MSHAPARQVETGMNKGVLNAEALRRGGWDFGTWMTLALSRARANLPPHIFSAPPRLRV